MRTLCPVQEEDTTWKLFPEAVRFAGKTGVPDKAKRLPVSHSETGETRDVCLYWATLRSQTCDYISANEDWHGHSTTGSDVV